MVTGMNKMKWIVLLLLLLCAAATFDSGRLRGVLTGGQTPEKVTVAVSAVSPDVFAAGIVEGGERPVGLRFEVPGKITRVHVKRGDAVRAGQLLAELDAADYGLQLEAAQIQHRIAVDLNGGQAGATKQSQYQVELAENRIRQAERLLEKTRILAPTDGIVMTVPFEPGELTGPADGSEALEVVNRQRTRIRAWIEELDALRVAPGQPAGVTVAGMPEKVYRAVVVECADSVRPKTHRHLNPGERIDVRVREVMLDVQDGSALLIGLPVEVMIRTASAKDGSSKKSGREKSTVQRTRSGI